MSNSNKRGMMIRSTSESGFSSASGSSRASRFSIFSSRSSFLRDREVPKQIDIAQKEQNYVSVSKYCMIFMLLLVAVAGCTGTYLYLKAEEEELFRSTFERYASEIVAVSTEHVESTFASIEALSNSVSSYAKNSNQTWPQVVIPDRTASLAAGARLVTLAPFVGRDERASFESYAIQEGAVYVGGH